MLDRVDLSHRESDRKAHYGCRKGLQSALLEHLHIRCDRSFIPEMHLVLRQIDQTTTLKHVQCNNIWYYLQKNTKLTRTHEPFHLQY